MLITRLGYNETNEHVLTVLNNKTGEYLAMPVMNAIDKISSNNVFKYVNEYQQTMSDEQSEELFRLFKYIQDNLDRDHTSTETMDALKEVIHKIVRVYDYEAFMKWFRKNCDEVFIHEKIKDKFVHDTDMLVVKERTYVKWQYIELVGLVIFLRGLMPAYITQLAFLIRGKNKHPHFNIFKLFFGSDIDSDDVETGLGKIREFVRYSYVSMVDASKREGRVLGAGLSDDDVEDTLVAMCLFNRLLIHDFIESKANTITRIYSTVSRDGPFETSETKTYKSKFKGSGDADGKDSRSRLECYQLITDLGMDDVAYIEHAIKGLIIDSDDFNYELYASELKNMAKFMQSRVEGTRLDLTGWLLASIIDPRSMHLDLNQRRVVELILMAKVHLMSTKHTFIATLLGSVIDEEASFINNVNVKGTLSPKLIERLNSMFEYKIMDGNTPVIVKEIIEKSKQIGNYTWRAYGHVDGRYVNNDGYLIPPNDIGEALVDFVEYMISRIKEED